MSWRAFLIVTFLAGARVAAADPAIDAVERALPHGWSLIATDSELLIRHDHAVFAASATPPASARTSAPRSAPTPAIDEASADHRDGPLIALELRYRLEPRWSPPQLAAARAANARADLELAGVRTRLRIDALPFVHGVPRATTPEEHARLAGYQRAEVIAKGKQIALPTCALGTFSVFDSPQTYAALAHPVDPPQALVEARAVVALVQQRCVADVATTPVT